MTTPNIKPIELKEHTCKQGHYGEIVPKLPMRSMLVAPSGAGKTVLLTNMTLDMYKGCFSRIIFGHQVIMLIIHGSQLRIITETISSQTIEINVILMNMTQVNYKQLLQPNRKS